MKTNIKKTTSYKKLYANISKLAKSIIKIQEKADELGLFTADRDLYECWKCGWMEDVECGGRLFSTFRNMPEIKNYNLKVVKKGKYYQCPSCREIL